MTNVWRVATATAILATTAMLTTSEARTDDLAWEWSPYRVQIAWNLATCGRCTEEVAASIRDAVGARLRERFGAAWVAADGDDVGTDDADADEPDKRFDVRLAFDGGAYVVEVREWDAVADETGQMIVHRTPQRDAVADLIVAAIVEAFRPVMLIDEAKLLSAHGRQRAAALFPPTALDSLTRRGAAYAPFVRRFDRDGFAIETKPIPWTLLTVDEPRGGEAVCLVRSGLNNPFSGRRRGRTERLAVAVGRPTGATTVRVTTRDGLPLAGCRVFVQDADAPAVPLGETDAAGSIVVGADDGRVRMLVVASRFVPLAKLPLVPGAVAEIVAPTTGTPELLAAEERLMAWQAEFLDLFVERRVQIALVAKHLDENDRASAEAAFKRLERIDTPSKRLSQLELLENRFAGTDKFRNHTIGALFDEAQAAATALDDSAAVLELSRRLTKLLR